MDEQSIPISAVEHYAYCPRQAALIHIEGVWADNAHTALGSAEHAVVDRETRLVRRQGRDCWLSLPVQSLLLGVHGVCDAVEFGPGPIPVEHKPVRSQRHFSPAAQQLTLQAMCLEEMMGTAVTHGVLFAHHEHRRQDVAIDESIRVTTLGTLRSLRAMLATPFLPARVLDGRCRHCSLREVCLVDEEGIPVAVSAGNAVFVSTAVGNW